MRRTKVVSSRDDEDAGRTRWVFADHAYQVRYTDAKGVVHTCTKHFKVARCDAFGNLLDTTVFRHARLAALARARAFWNENDKTLVARYEKENDSDA